MNFTHWPTLCRIACQSMITGRPFDQTVNDMYNNQAVSNELQRAQHLKIKRANRAQSHKAVHVIGGLDD